MATANTITLVAEESRNIDTITYRGSAPLSALARISQADVFDQVTNPDGLQRDFNRKHALEAHDYVARDADKKFPRAYPEVLLNVRDKRVCDVKKHEVTVAGRKLNMAALTFDTDKIANAKSVKVSRVDGNHRLMYGDGDGKDRPPLDVLVPFAITVGLTRDQEASLFLDVNANQKGLSTSHLDYMRSRMTPEELEFERNPARAIAKRLVQDSASPWHGIVHLGGSKRGLKEKELVTPVNFVALESAVKRLLRGETIQTLTPDAKYGVIRNYWQAVATVFKDEWESPRDYYVLKNVGIQALATLGSEVIQRGLFLGPIDPADFAAELEHVRGVFDWHRDRAAGDGGLGGLSGNRAALEVAGKLRAKLPKITPARRAQAAKEERPGVPEDPRFAQTGDGDGDAASTDAAQQQQQQLAASTAE